MSGTTIAVTILSALSMPSDRPNHYAASLSQLALGSDSPSWLPALFLPAPEQGRFSGHAAAHDLAPMVGQAKVYLVEGIQLGPAPPVYRVLLDVDATTRIETRSVNGKGGTMPSRTPWQ